MTAQDIIDKLLNYIRAAGNFVICWFTTHQEDNISVTRDGYTKQWTMMSYSGGITVSRLLTGLRFKLEETDNDGEGGAKMLTTVVASSDEVVATHNNLNKQWSILTGEKGWVVITEKQLIDTLLNLKHLHPRLPKSLSTTTMMVLHKHMIEVLISACPTDV